MHWDLRVSIAQVWDYNFHVPDIFLGEIIYHCEGWRGLPLEEVSTPLHNMQTATYDARLE